MTARTPRMAAVFVFAVMSLFLLWPTVAWAQSDSEQTPAPQLEPYVKVTPNTVKLGTGIDPQVLVTARNPTTDTFTVSLYVARNASGAITTTVPLSQTLEPRASVVWPLEISAGDAPLISGSYYFQVSFDNQDNGSRIVDTSELQITTALEATPSPTPEPTVAPTLLVSATLLGPERIARGVNERAILYATNWSTASIEVSAPVFLDSDLFTIEWPKGSVWANKQTWDTIPAESSRAYAFSYVSNDSVPYNRYPFALGLDYRQADDNSRVGSTSLITEVTIYSPQLSPVATALEMIHVPISFTIPLLYGMVAIFLFLFFEAFAVRIGHALRRFWNFILPKGQRDLPTTPPALLAAPLIDATLVSKILLAVIVTLVVGVPMMWLVISILVWRSGGTGLEYNMYGGTDLEWDRPLGAAVLVAVLVCLAAWLIYHFGLKKLIKEWFGPKPASVQDENAPPTTPPVPG